jgi:hypothetical protein
MNATPKARSALKRFWARQKSRKSLVVASIERKGPLVLNLESGSRATAGPVGHNVLALVAGAVVDALAYF